MNPTVSELYLYKTALKETKYAITFNPAVPISENNDYVHKKSAHPCSLTVLFCNSPQTETTSYVHGSMIK